MAKYKVEITGIDTSSIKVLSNDEMYELFRKYQAGDLSAKDELVNGNLKLVLSVLKSFQNRCDNMDDLFQVGVMGLIKAIDNFDLSYGLKLSTYACPLISGECKRYLRDNSTLRISRSIKDLAYKVLRAKEELVNIHNREVSIAELSEYLGYTEYEISNAIDSLRDTMSIYEPIYNDGGDTIFLIDQLGDKKTIPINDKIALMDGLENLGDRERDIIYSRYFLGKTQVELSSEIGISQAQISRLEKKGIKVLKKSIK